MADENETVPEQQPEGFQLNVQLEPEDTKLDIKAILPIALGLVLVLLFFFKAVLPSLENNVDHSASHILDNGGMESEIERIFGND